MGFSLRAACAVVVLSLPLSAAARKTVAIAPLTSGSTAEYHWVGAAIAGALSLRVHQQPELNAVTLRQVNAAMRHDNIQRQQLSDPAVVMDLGRQLGADLMLAGTYTAKWPDIDVVLRVVDPKKRKVIQTHNIKGYLDDLFAVEARAAEALARELGAEKPDVKPGAFGTTHLRAWRATTLALGILNWQSLSPIAADKNRPLKLPPEAIAKADRYLQDATRFDPDFGEAWAALGVAQALAGKTKVAWKSFGKATALGAGHYPSATLGASFVRMREGRWEDAEQILTSAIERHPGFLHARGYLGQLYNHTGRRREALAAFDEYAKLVPDQPWVLAQRGYTKSKLGDSPGAIADTIAAVDLLPESPSLLLQLASRYIDARKLVGAEDALMHAMKKFPEHGRIYIRLGYVYLLQGKDELVIPITEKALLQARLGNKSNDLMYAHLNLARAYGHQGNLDKAFHHLTKARANGLGSMSEIEADGKLDELRKDPRYRKLKS